MFYLFELFCRIIVRKMKIKKVSVISTSGYTLVVVVIQHHSLLLFLIVFSMPQCRKFPIIDVHDNTDVDP